MKQQNARLKQHNIQHSRGYKNPNTDLHSIINRRLLPPHQPTPYRKYKPLLGPILHHHSVASSVSRTSATLPTGKGSTGLRDKSEVEAVTSNTSIQRARGHQSDLYAADKSREETTGTPRIAVLTDAPPVARTTSGSCISHGFGSIEDGLNSEKGGRGTIVLGHLDGRSVHENRIQRCCLLCVLVGVQLSLNGPKIEEVGGGGRIHLHLKQSVFSHCTCDRLF